MGFGLLVTFLPASVGILLGRFLSPNTALNTVFGLRNLPNKITTDAGKNVTKSPKTIIESLQSNFSGKDIEEIQSTWPQITWCIIPPGAHHRIGGAESMVKATKRSLRYLPTSS